MTNTGLVAAFGKNAAYVGGIVGINDADWGGSQDPKATATVQNCANRMSGDNATDTRRINLLKGAEQPCGQLRGRLRRLRRRYRGLQRQKRRCDVGYKHPDAGCHPVRQQLRGRRGRL